MLEALIWILKINDSKLINIRFASSITALRPSSRVDIRQAIETRKPKGQPDLGQRFDDVIEEYRRKLGERHHLRSLWDRTLPKSGTRKLSVYVLTDGHWRSESDFVSPLKSLSKDLKSRQLDPSYVRVHLIRFGGSATELDRIEELVSDAELKKCVRNQSQHS